MTSSPAAGPVRTSIRALILTAVVLATVGAIAVFHPFTGDQALFADSARRIANGAVLSRDIWDVKQPGIYLYYLAGGAIGGYSSVWLYAFDCLVTIAFAGFCVVALRAEFSRTWIAAIVPLAGIGTWLATIEPVQHAQVEGVVGIPLFVALWATVRADAGAHRGRTWLVVAGVAGGVALAFKLVLAPVVLALWLTGVLARRAPGRTDSARRLAWIALGAALPIGACLVYFAAHGELGRVWWTYVEVTPQTIGVAGRPVARLVDGATTMAVRWALPGALALVGLWSRRRAGWSRLDLGCAWWIALAVPVFLVQHWWIYQYALFAVPLGWFAARGVEKIVDASPEGRTRLVVAAAAIALAVPIGFRLARNTAVVARHGLGLSGDDRERIRRELEPQYADAAKWAQFTAFSRRPADAQYVLGNPLLAYRAGLPEPVAINGWSPEQYPDEVWDRLLAQLDRARPRFLAVDRFSERIVRTRHRETWNWIRRHYRLVAGVNDVDFYVRRAEFDPAPRGQR